MEIIDRSFAEGNTQVRLVGQGTNKIVTMEEAFRIAETSGLDLVCVSDNTNPIVVKIEDFKKVEYERKKSRKAQKAKSRASVLKDIQLKVNISDHDLETKVNNIRKFLERGDKVRISIRLKGRERETPERATDLIKKIAEQVECKLTIIPGPRQLALLEPAK